MEGNFDNSRKCVCSVENLNVSIVVNNLQARRFMTVYVDCCLHARAIVARALYNSISLAFFFGHHRATVACTGS